MSYFPKTTIQGITDAGNPIDISAEQEGHLEVAIHGPLNPFYSVHTESLTPIFQMDPLYGVNEAIANVTTGLAVGFGANSATASAANNYFVCSTGTTQYSFGTIQSLRRLRYRPGQGVIIRAAGKFSTPAANSILVLGCGSSESGFFFGYNGTTFGILYSTGGVREIQTLTVTTASTSTQPYNIGLPSGETVNVTATNSGSTVKTAYEIAQGTFPGWKAAASGSTVVFVKDSVGGVSMITLGQSGAGTPAAGTFVETKAGAAATDTWIAQSTWNGDKLDGTGASGVTLDPSKGNVYQINIQYLGAGAVDFKIEVPSVDGNNSTMVTVHTLNFPNSLTTTIVSQPVFPFTMAAYSAGSTTDVAVYVSSAAGFIEGQRALTGPRQTYFSLSTAVTTTNYYALFTIRNNLSYGGRANQSVVNLLSFGGAHDDATPVTFFLIRNGTLSATPNFSQWATSSCTSAYKPASGSAETVTFSSNDQVLLSLPVSQSGAGFYIFEDNVTLQPGETVTVAAQTVTGTSTYTIATLNTREDQ